MMLSRNSIAGALWKRYLTTIDASETTKFSKLSSKWWNKTGELKPLHSMNTLRLPFIRDGLIQSGFVKKDKVLTSKPLEGLKILDVGCGGGILSEPLCRLGGEVTGLDACEEGVKEAQEHAASSGLNISYIVSSIEEHALENSGKYDAVVASEILEHVSNKTDFIESCTSCLKPEGAIFITTMSKTLLAEIFAINVAEFIGIVPKGVHEIDKFIEPHELQRMLEKSGCRTKIIHGMRYNFLTDEWAWTCRTEINYALFAVKCS